jgi:pectate lyase
MKLKVIPHPHFAHAHRNLIRLIWAGSLAVLLLGGILPVSGEILFTEEFPVTYGEGNSLGNNVTTGGWNTKWAYGNSTGAGAAITTANGALGYAPLAPIADTPTFGLRAATATSRRLAAGIPNQSGDGTTVYCSFLLKVTAATPVDRQLIGFRNSTGGGNQSAAVGINAARQLTLYKNSADPAVTHATVLNQEQVYFVVFRLRFQSGSDDVAMWLNPVTGAVDESGAVATPISTTGSFDQSSAITLQIPSVADASGSLYLDEICVATTWAEVTPGAGPIVAAKLSLAQFVPVAFVGEPLSPVVVQVQTPGGLDVPTNGVTVTLALTGGSGALNGTLTQTTDANGRAVFTGLSFDTLGNGKEITATASGLGAGLDPAVRGNLWVIRNPDAGAALRPVITQTALTGNNVILQGHSGPANGEYRVLASTDATQPLSAWPAIATNNFDGGGWFASTNLISPLGAQRFFALAITGSGSSSMFQHRGYAVVPAPITGGGNTTNIVVVTNLAGFMAATSDLVPRIVYVDGTITLRDNGNTYLSGNKTIIGLGETATLIGNLGIFFEEGSTVYSATNIIIRNLTITNPNGYGEDDAITIKNGGRHVWIDHCTMYNTPDEMVPITRESDFITISWCKFYYDTFAAHNSPHLIGGSEDDLTDNGKLHVTFHHNWYATNCNERMASVRFGRVHMFNNFFNSPGNNYCSRARLYSEVLLENNHYEAVQNPWELIVTSGPTGLLRATGNLTNNCTFTTAYAHNTGGTLILVDGSDSLTPAATDPIGLNPPPYSYTLDPVNQVETLVTTHAGAGKGPFAP